MIDPSRRAEIEEALRGWLRVRLEAPTLDFAEPPQCLLGGNRTHVYAFRLAGAPAPYAGALVLRILRFPEAGDVRIESALHDALLAQRFPVPRVLAFGEGGEPFGAAFQILERIPGRALLHGYDDPGVTGRGLLHQQLADLRGALLAPWPERLADLHARLHGLDAERIRVALVRAGVPTDRLGLEERLRVREASLHRHGVEVLAPAFAWLRDHLPGADVPRVLCHGDFFPNQVCVAGEVLGVLDWSDACLAPAELDVGVVTAGLETLPLLPGGLAGFGGAVLGWLSRRFRRAYTRQRRLDPARLRFAEACRCVFTLASVIERRLALARVSDRAPAPNPYDRAAAVAVLLARLHAITSVRVALAGPFSGSELLP